MRAASLVVRGFRNLADATWDIPRGGFTLVGPNGHGKTNVLEALAYPVLFRSLRGARDRDVAQFGGPGFHVGLRRDDGVDITSTWSALSGDKRVTVDGVEESRVTGALGQWVAVSFLPTDPAIVQGGAAVRRRWLDRMLSLADPVYLAALLKYRAALAQRNAALRRGSWPSAEAFDGELARSGSMVVAQRRAWVAGAQEAWREELGTLGEVMDVSLRYRGDDALTDPEAWSPRLVAAKDRDLARGQTHVGPQRDDLTLGLGGRAFREFGSTGQQRTAAIGLRLVELETLARARSDRPALLVDDVFAELDHDRQNRLALRLVRDGSQLVVTAPRVDDLPQVLELPRWRVTNGLVDRG